jgi:WhiB family transcriptional regulator, redox-sensing transcriptional regulator
LTAVVRPGTIAAVIIDPAPVVDATWREEAACLSHPSILFFGHDDSEPNAERRTREDRAKQVCSGCGVRTKCLEYALATREPYGIWGGMTELERRARLRRVN